jgi:hypothetical protein
MDYNYQDSYNGNIKVKRDGVEQKWTMEQVTEYGKCMADPAYFAKTYCMIINLDEGLVPFELYPYQEKMFKNFNENRFNIVLACRQSGKSISSVAYLLWYAIFNESKTVAVLANKGLIAREMISRITLMLENLPFFLQPGCKSLNKGSIEFSNNSRILSAGTSSSSVRGFAANLIYLDEFAFVEDATTFYTSTYPVISAGKSTKVIITSTANGIGNIFQKLWESAIQGTSSYIPFRVDWWDVPGRDEEWKQETIANTSVRQFEQEFGNTFFGTGDTLINAMTLMGLRAQDPLHTIDDIMRVYAEPDKKHNYVMMVDVAKGRGLDYSTFNIIDLTVSPWQQVFTYRSNMISPLLFPNLIYKYANMYNECLVVIEANDAGQVVCNGLYYDLEYENMFVESAIKASALGLNMSKKVKRIGCSSFKDLLEENKLNIVDENTILEVSTFVAKGSSYEASEGNHDDLVMNFVLLGYFAGTNFFNDLTDIDLSKMLFEDRMLEIENEMPAFGYIDNGEDYIKELERKEVPDVFDDPWAIAEVPLGPDF